jgi:DNA-binding NarL/FixJ family response regulator
MGVQIGVGSQGIRYSETPGHVFRALQQPTGVPKDADVNSKLQVSLSIALGQQSGTKSGSQNTRLLLVDDHALLRRGLIGWLRTQTKFEIIGEAETAREALAQAILFKPDIVLLDVALRGEGGIRVAFQIVHACPATRVIAFSASAEPVDVRGMLAAGALGYVLKTSDPSTVLSAIRAALAGRRFLDPGLSDVMVEELSLLAPAGRRSRDILTPRETEVLQRCVWGYTNREIGTQLSINTNSVNSYRTRVCGKLGLTSKAELVRYGIAVGLMKFPPPAKHLPSSVALSDMPSTEGREPPRCEKSDAPKTVVQEVSCIWGLGSNGTETPVKDYRQRDF